jgi:hypothetical protein
MEGRVLNCLSKPFFFGSYLAAVLSGQLIYLFTILSAGPGKPTPEQVLRQLPLNLLGAGLGLYAFVVLLILIYRLWRIVPPNLARTTPGKAACFLLIPFFNFYWNFVALWGWTRDYNVYLRQNQRSELQVSENLALAISILYVVCPVIAMVAVLAQAQQAAFLTGLPLLILFPLFIYQACSSVNALPDEMRQPKLDQALPSEQPSGRSVASLVLGILSIAIPYLGLIVGIVAIVLSAKQRKIRPDSYSTAGLITGIVGTVLWSLITLFLIGATIALIRLPH